MIKDSEPNGNKHASNLNCLNFDMNTIFICYCPPPTTSSW